MTACFICSFFIIPLNISLYCFKIVFIESLEGEPKYEHNEGSEKCRQCGQIAEAAYEISHTDPMGYRAGGDGRKRLYRDLQRLQNYCDTASTDVMNKS